jgi:hypothetical protein
MFFIGQNKMKSNSRGNYYLRSFAIAQDFTGYDKILRNLSFRIKSQKVMNTENKKTCNTLFSCGLSAAPAQDR